MSSALVDAGPEPMYPFGATGATGGVSNYTPVQPRIIAWLTQW